MTDRCDIYALGVISYELLTGVQPFRASSDAEIVARHQKGAPRALRELAPQVPPEVEELVHQMLSKDPAQRPSATQVLERLHQLREEQFAAGPPPPSTLSMRERWEQMPAEAMMALRQSIEMLVTDSPYRRAATAVVLALIILVLGYIMIYTARRAALS